jgi:hypothetical protein
VAAAAHGHRNAGFKSKVNRRDDVRNSRTPRNHGRSLSDHSVEDFAGLFVTGIT